MPVTTDDNSAKAAGRDNNRIRPLKADCSQPEQQGQWLLEAIPIFRGSGFASNSHRCNKGEGAKLGQHGHLGPVTEAGIPEALD